MQKNKADEKRKSPFRRQVNEAFCDPNGNFSIKKFLVIWTQIVVLGHMGISWDKLIEKPETLFIILSFLIAPEIISKFLTMKLGGTVSGK